MTMKLRSGLWLGVGLSLLLAAACGPAPVAPSPMPAPASAPTPAAPAPVGTPAVLERIDLSDGLYLRKLQENMFVVTHAFPWPANALMVEMANGEVVLAGSTYTPEAMAEVLKWLAGHWGQRKIVAIDTGYHVDNLGGNGALIEQGIPVYGSDLTAQLLKERGEKTRQAILGMLTGAANARYYKAQAELAYVAPTQLFPIAQGLDLTFGEEHVNVYYPGPSQAPDKVVVYFPSQKVLFGSCMVLGGDQVGNASDADLQNWPDAVRKLKQFDAEIVVPGHGDRLDAGLIDHTLAVLAAKP